MITGNTPQQPARLYTEPPITAFENATRQFDEAAGVLGLTPNQIAIVKLPRLIVQANLPVQDGRRDDPDLPGLPGAAQQGARPGQGRHPLPPGREPGRGHGALLLDDLQVRRDRIPMGGGKGGMVVDPSSPLITRAGAPLAPLHRRALRVLRPRRRRARSRRGHQLPDHGLDDGHLRHALAPLHAGRHHRQAARDRRLGRARGGHGARAALQRAALGPAHRQAAARHDGRRAGIRQRRLLERAPAGRGRLPGGGDLRRDRRLPQPRRDPRRERHRPRAGQPGPARRLRADGRA